MLGHVLGTPARRPRSCLEVLFSVSLSVIYTILLRGHQMPKERAFLAPTALSSGCVATSRHHVCPSAHLPAVCLVASAASGDHHTTCWCCRLPGRCVHFLPQGPKKTHPISPHKTCTRRSPAISAASPFNSSSSSTSSSSCYQQLRL